MLKGINKIALESSIKQLKPAQEFEGFGNYYQREINKLKLIRQNGKKDFDMSVGFLAGFTVGVGVGVKEAIDAKTVDKTDIFFHVGPPAVYGSVLGVLAGAGGSLVVVPLSIIGTTIIAVSKYNSRKNRENETCKLSK